MEGDKNIDAVGLLGWINQRFPASSTFRSYASEYYVPKNFNIWYIFGSLALLVLFIQIVTGIFLVMHYKPDAEQAFQSVEYIMREVPYGWLIRTMHSTGASMFFVVMYLHMLRGIIYGSYRKPRELVWIFGMAIFLCLTGEAFFGYLLPWGQISFWSAQVIINLLTVVPVIGPELSLLVRGDYVVSDATLSRFFALHVIAVPLILIGLVVAHIVALHEVGPNNPDGVDIEKHKDKYGRPLDGIPFHPFYTVHNILVVVGFLFIFAAIVFFAPEMGGYFLEYSNLIPADPLRTPPHITPVWYFTPFYSILRAATSQFTWILAATAVLVVIYTTLRGKLSKMWRLVLLFTLLIIVVSLRMIDAKFWGIMATSGAVLLLLFLPWLDRSPVKSIRYRPNWHKVLYGIFIISFLFLGYVGTQPPSEAFNLMSQICTLIYLGFFFLMPIWSQIGAFKPEPDRVIFHPY